MIRIRRQDGVSLPRQAAAAGIRLEPLLLAAITLAGGALRLFQLGHASLWVDEGFSWRWAHLSLSAMWGADGSLEYNPPLYYTLQRAALAFGDEPALVRLPAAVLGTAAVPLVYALARVSAGPMAGLLAGTFLALSGPHIAYSQEARGYTLLADAALLAALGLALFLAAWRQPDAAGRRSSGLLGLVLYGAGTGVALYTHATAVFLPVLASLVVLAFSLTHARRPAFALAWIGTNAVVLLAWSWWLPVVVAQALGPDDMHSFITQPGGFRAVTELLRLYGAYYLHRLRPWDLALAPVGLLMLPGLWWLRRRWEAAGLLAAFAFGLPLLLWLAGLLGKPLWLTRTLLCSLPFGLVLVAAGVAGFRAARARAVLTALVLAVSAANLGAYYRVHTKEPWDRAAAAIVAGRSPGDVIVLFSSGDHGTLRYYLRRAGYDGPVLGVDDASSPQRSINDVRVPGVDDALVPVRPDDVGRAVRATSRLWFVARWSEDLDPGGAIRARIVGLGKVVEQRELKPHLELFLIETKRQGDS